MDCRHWRFLRTKVEEKGQTLTFSFDESDAKVLQERDCRLFFSFGRVTVRIKSNQKRQAARTDEIPAPTAAPETRPLVPSGPKPKVGAVADHARPSSSLEQVHQTHMDRPNLGGTSPAVGGFIPQTTARGRGAWRPGGPNPTAGTRGGGGQHQPPPNNTRGRGSGGPNRGRSGARTPRASGRPRGLTRGRPVQLPSLASEHSSKKASRNPFNNLP